MREYKCEKCGRTHVEVAVVTEKDDIDTVRFMVSRINTANSYMNSPNKNVVAAAIQVEADSRTSMDAWWTMAADKYKFERQPNLDIDTETGSIYYTKEEKK